MFQQAADQVFSWFNGHQLPFMEPVVEVETFLEPEVDKPQKTDADLVKEDVIKVNCHRLCIDPYSARYIDTIHVYY